MPNQKRQTVRPRDDRALSAANSVFGHTDECTDHTDHLIVAACVVGLVVVALLSGC